MPQLLSNWYLCFCYLLRGFLYRCFHQAQSKHVNCCNGKVETWCYFQGDGYQLMLLVTLPAYRSGFPGGRFKVNKTFTSTIMSTFLLLHIGIEARVLTQGDMVAGLYVSLSVNGSHLSYTLSKEAHYFFLANYRYFRQFVQDDHHPELF